MSPSRFAKSLLRRLRVSWREQPTQRDIEAVEENARRVGMIIRFRWALVAALAAFSLFGAGIYLLDPAVTHQQLLANMRVPAVALVFVIAYNLYYHLTYKRLGNIAILNHAQLLFDTLVISVLVYYSGGVYSWFHSMYALIVLEAAFIFPRQRDTWIVAGSAALSYALVLWLDYSRVLPHVSVPFASNTLQYSASYAAVRCLWNVTVLSGTGMVSLQMMSRVHSREERLHAATIADETTGLTNRTYFLRKLSSEIQRARCYSRGLTVLLLDIDDFAGFNRRFGLRAGNRMLHALASLLEGEVHRCDSAVAELATVSRYGGEEFAVILPDPAELSAEEAMASARAFAEHLCSAAGALRIDDMGVTVSVGAAFYPADGLTGGDVMASADQALFLAATSGGNRVAAADDSPAEAGAVV